MFLHQNCQSEKKNLNFFLMANDLDERDFGFFLNFFLETTYSLISVKPRRQWWHRSELLGFVSTTMVTIRGLQLLGRFAIESAIIEAVGMWLMMVFYLWLTNATFLLYKCYTIATCFLYNCNFFGFNFLTIQVQLPFYVKATGCKFISIKVQQQKWSVAEMEWQWRWSDDGDESTVEMEWTVEKRKMELCDRLRRGSELDLQREWLARET